MYYTKTDESTLEWLGDHFPLQSIGVLCKMLTSDYTDVGVRAEVFRSQSTAQIIRDLKGSDRCILVACGPDEEGREHQAKPGTPAHWMYTVDIRNREALDNFLVCLLGRTKDCLYCRRVVFAQCPWDGWNTAGILKALLLGCAKRMRYEDVVVIGISTHPQFVEKYELDSLAELALTLGYNCSRDDHFMNWKHSTGEYTHHSNVQDARGRYREVGDMIAGTLTSLVFSFNPSAPAGSPPLADSPPTDDVPSSPSSSIEVATINTAKADSELVHELVTQFTAS